MERMLLPARAGLALLTVIAVGAVAGPAEAASTGYATAGTTKVTFTARVGAKNKVVITRSGRTVTIDDRVTVKPGKGCKRVTDDKTKVRCTTTKTPTQVVVKLYDRNDSVTNNSDLKMVANGGAGNDTLVGGPKQDTLTGDDVCAHSTAGNDRIYGRGGNDQILAADGSDYVNAGDGNDDVSGGGNCADGAKYDGNDVIRGGNGNDLLQGGAGNDQVYGDNGNDVLFGALGKDRLDGGPGNDELEGDADAGTAAADVLLGGAGRDLVTYASYTKAVTVDLDGATGDDGIAGEHDTVGADVEDILSGSGNDHLTGNTAANDIDGQDGNDVIHGGASNDHLTGRTGVNTIYGEDGDDELSTWNETGISLLDGGPNNDLCRAKAGNTLVSCEILLAP